MLECTTGLYYTCLRKSKQAGKVALSPPGAYSNARQTDVLKLNVLVQEARALHPSLAHAFYSSSIGLVSDS